MTWVRVNHIHNAWNLQLQISLDWHQASHLVKLSSLRPSCTNASTLLKIWRQTVNALCLWKKSFILHRSGLCLLLGGCFALCFLAESVVFLEICNDKLVLGGVAFAEAKDRFPWLHDASLITQHEGWHKQADFSILCRIAKQEWSCFAFEMTTVVLENTEGRALYLIMQHAYCISHVNIIYIESYMLFWYMGLRCHSSSCMAAPQPLLIPTAWICMVWLFQCVCLCIYKHAWYAVVSIGLARLVWGVHL